MINTEVDYFCCPFNVDNVGMNGVRMDHVPSGATAQACDAQQREKNEEIALERLMISEKYKEWKRAEVANQSVRV